MKKFLLMLLPLAALVAGCRYDDSEVWEELNNHEQRILALEKAINTDLASVQGIVTELQNKVYVGSVTPTANGFTLNFTDGKSFTVTNGTNGNTPNIGVKQDTDGNYYWTLNGEWLTDAGGNKIRTTGDKGETGAAGVTPQVKIENNKWYVSIDGGTTWTEAGNATVVGDSLFKKVELSADGKTVIFTFQDDSTIEIPIVPTIQKLQLVFDETKISSILSGETATVDYTIVIPEGETVEFDTFENNGYTVKVTATDATSGSIAVTAPNPAVKGKVLFILTGDKGSSFVKTVTINGEPTLSADKTEYSTDWKAGELTVTMKANVAYTSEIEAGKTWITAGAAANKFNLEANTGEDNRTAKITFKADGVADVVVTVTQTGKEAIVLTAAEEDVTYSADELSVVINTNAVVTAAPDVDWITIDEATKALEKKTFTFKLAPNTGAAREGHIVFTAGEAKQTVTVKQAAAPAYVLATKVEAGKYLIVAKTDDAFIAASPLEASKTYGYLNGANVTVAEKAVENRLAAAEFTIAATEGGYTICGPDGRFVYQSGSYNSFNVAEEPTEGQVWSIEIDADGLATITNNSVNKYWQYSTGHKSYGSYASAQTGGVKPSLYKLLNGDAQSLGTVNFDKASVSVKVGETFTNAATTNSDATVVYESSDEKIATVDSKGVITGVAAGEATITASVKATEKFSAASATCKVTVTNVIYGTLENPYTISGVIAYIDGLAGAESADVYVKGVVSELTNFKFGPKYNTASFWMTEDGKDSDVKFEAYSCYYFGGEKAKWYEGISTQIALGQEIVLCGKVKKYNTTYETDTKKAWIYSIDGKTADPTSIVASDVTGIVAAGVADKTLDVTLVSADGWTASVTPDGTVVTAASIKDAVITYTVAANTGAARDGKITVKLSKSGETDITKDIKVSQLAGNSGGGSVPNPETITFSELGLTNAVQYLDPFNGGHFTVTFAGGANDGKYYTTGTGIRIYGGGNFTVASTTNKIVKIELTWSGSANAPTGDVATPTGYDTATSTWTGSASSIVFARPSGSGHWRLQAVKVTYGE